MNVLYLYAGVAVAAVLAVAAGGVAYWYRRQYTQGYDEEFDDLLDEEDSVAFEPPDITRTPLDYLHVMRHQQKAKRAAKKGYVRWELLGSTASRQRWVKPELKGNGVPEYDHKGQTYLFPKDAMVIDEETGAWKAQHRNGEADPINLRDPAYPGLETDLIERTINLMAESEPDTGLFAGLGGLNTTQMMYGGMALLFLLYAAYMYSTGAI